MKTLPLLVILAALPFAALSQPATSPAPKAEGTVAAPAAAAGKSADPRVELAAKIPGAKPEDIRPTPIPGIYELAHGADVSYVTADAKYIFSGDLYRVTAGSEFPNLSEERRRDLRTKLVAAVPESEMIVFGPKNAKYTITVFTDVDCPWCRRLHSQMADYNRLGIRVRYLAWPRTAPKSESWVKAQNVWCAKNRAESLSKAIAGEAVAAASCQDPVQRHHDLGRRLGVNGTPGVLLPDGELVPGYMPPEELAKHLQSGLALQ
jgi:thiol:disulfide interchange protein DsbC